MATANTVVYNGPIPGSVGPVAPDGQQAITVPDYFSSYFPYTATGGTTNPMTGLDLVQGQQPQDLRLDLILAGIQSQYTPQTFTTSGGSYGAGRFITNPLDAGGDGTNVGGAVTPPAPWFTPGEFNLADYQNTVAPEAAEKIATGTVYGDSNVSPVDSVSDTGWLSDPYAGLDPISDAARQAIGSVIPGAGMIIGAGQGYTGATATNTLNDVLGYLGQDGFGNISPAKASVLGAFGITPESIKDAQDFYAIFDKDAATMLNWAALPMDTATNQIVDFLMEGAQNPLSPQDIGVMAFAVGTDINKAVVEGKSLTDAVRDVAISKGVSPTTAAEMGVQASRSAVTNALAQGLTLEDIDPAAVAVYNDPLGALIDALGITGRIDESLTEQLGALDYATPDDISEALAGLDFTSPDDISEALAALNFATPEDISTALGALDYSTPDDISTALAELDFATPDDISTALSALDYSTPDDISTALAELDFATADDIDTAISGLNFATADDIVNALADLNFTTPDDMAAALENLDFATPQDVIDGLANAGYATTDEIADAIAGLDIPTVDDIVSAIATPVTETPLAPVTEIPPFDEVGPPLPPGYVAEESQVPELFVPIDEGLVTPVVTLPPTVTAPSVPVDNGLTSNITDGGYVGPTSYEEGEVGGVTVGGPISIDPGPTPTAIDPGTGYSESGSGSTDYGDIGDFGGPGDSVDFGGGYDAEGGVADGVDADGGGDGGDGGSGGCVIATHAVANGSFTPREKRKAVVWCTKTLHHKWWGEAIRRGYRFYGMRAINAGKAENYYDEFRDFVRFATGTKRNAKTAKTFIWRSVQFFITGIFLKD